MKKKSLEDDSRLKQHTKTGFMPVSIIIISNIIIIVISNIVIIKFVSIPLKLCLITSFTFFMF